MKTILISVLLVMSSMVFSRDCETVSKACLKKLTLSTELNKFIALERMIGEKSYDLNYMNHFQVFVGENIYGNFTMQNASQASLSALGDFAVKHMGVYDAPEYDGFEMLKNAEKMDRKKFVEFLGQMLMDVDERIVDIASGEREDFSAELKSKIKEYLKTKNSAKQMITDLIFSDDVEEVVVYDLLDNNNENVQDAQYVIVSDDKVILVGHFWYL
jgi:hypothetical protein